jgi:Polysaccharide biosynthesis enzyme WcbI/Tetratricopeptide repeat
MRKVVFIGNCQAVALCQLYQRFAVPESPESAVWIASYGEASSEARQQIADADALVVQILDFEQRIGDIESNASKYAFPHVYAPFLWPHAGEEHPLNKAFPPFSAAGPYSAEEGDRYLNRMIRAGVDPDEAVDRYLAEDVVNTAHVGRLYEMSMDRQRKRDQVCGVDTVSLIERYLPDEQLFRTVNHPEKRILGYLAVELFEQLGVRSDIREKWMEGRLPDTAPPHDMPVHPSVAKHFGLRWAGPDARYIFHHEGRYTFEEWARRYARFEWSPVLEHGIHLALINDPVGAEGLLRQAIDEVPRSSVARSALAEVLAKQERFAEAAVWMQRAADMDPDNEYCRARAASLAPFAATGSQV